MQVIVAGGGPAGSVAAEKLAAAGIRTIIFERSLRGDKTCAGGIPSVLVNDFKIPDELIHQKCHKVRFNGPSGVKVEMTFPNDGYLATVRRLEFDSFLRRRAVERGVILEEKEVMGYELIHDGVKVQYKDKDNRPFWAKADYLIGAEGAVSRVARILHTTRLSYVATLQEYIRPSQERMKHWDDTAELYYASKVSPDYYGWVFPHRDYVAIGVGMGYESAKNIKEHLEHLKSLNQEWLDGGEIMGRGSAPIPLDHFADPSRRRIFLVGDAAGFVLPGSGEGIYYAMKSGLFAAEAIIASHREHHANPEIIYNRRCEREFTKSFNYFKRIEKLAFKSDYTRELFVRYTAYPGSTDNFLNAFSWKAKKRKSGLIKRIRMIRILNRIRGEMKREGLRLN
jgi:geranylgeranyl reductase